MFNSGCLIILYNIIISCYILLDIIFYHVIDYYTTLKILPARFPVFQEDKASVTEMTRNEYQARHAFVEGPRVELCFFFLRELWIGYLVNMDVWAFGWKTNDYAHQKMGVSKK